MTTLARDHVAVAQAAQNRRTTCRYKPAKGQLLCRYDLTAPADEAEPRLLGRRLPLRMDWILQPITQRCIPVGRWKPRKLHCLDTRSAGRLWRKSALRAAYRRLQAVHGTVGRYRMRHCCYTCHLPVDCESLAPLKTNSMNSVTSHDP